MTMLDHYLCLAIITAVVAMVTVVTVAEGKKDIRLLGLLSMSGPRYSGGRACDTPIQMALKAVNEHQDILPDYNFVYEYVDSECHGGIAAYRMIQKMTYSKPYVMLLGPACSTAAVATAEISYFWNLTQLAFGSASPALSDRVRFPKFYRLGVPDNTFTRARKELMTMFNWNKIATIHEAGEFFSMNAEDFIQDMNNNNFTVITQEIFMHDPTEQVQNLKKHDARIIYAAMYEDKAKAMLCAAYHIGLYGPKIVWFLFGWYTKTFWKTNLDEVDCTEAQMSKVVEGAFLFVSAHRNPKEVRGLANLTISEFDELLHNHPDYNPEVQHLSFLVGACYDHIWLAALALNCTNRRLIEIGHHKTLDQFEYSDGDINEIIYECLTNTTLTGVSAKLSFADGEPSYIVTTERIQSGKRRLIGLYRQDNDPAYYEWNTDYPIVWKDGKIPRDSTFISPLEHVIPLTMYVPLCTFSVLGMALAAFFLVFNVTHRNNKTVKMSSPNINNVMLMGCVISYITVLFKTTQTDKDVICKARLFTFTIGFMLTFSSLFSKTWRVYRIFTNKKLLRMTIKDSRLLAIIAGLVLAVLSVLFIWELVSPLVMVILYLEKEVYTIGNDVEVRPFIRMCESGHGYLGWIIYSVQGFLLALSAFLAFETRHVKIDALNDSHEIGLCVYMVTALSAVGLLLTVMLSHQVVVLYGVTSGCLIVGTTLTQLIVFIPKVLAVYRGDAVTRTTIIAQPQPTIIVKPTNKGTLITKQQNIQAPVKKSSEETGATKSTEHTMLKSSEKSSENGTTKAAESLATKSSEKSLTKTSEDGDETGQSSSSA